MTNRIMGDSTTLADIPTSVAVVATYGNGSYATTEAAVEARFPRARYGHARIDVNGERADIANVLDVETGDATPPVARVWVQSFRKLHPGQLPVVYCNRSPMPAVIAECAKAGLVPGAHYGLWIATLDGTEVPHRAGDGIVACQHKGAAQTGGHWDESVIYDPNIWLPATAPKPAGPSKAAALAALGTLRAYLEAQ
jgi:hypothetical protein